MDGTFDFQVDTELIVHGVTRPDARVTLRGEPVKIRSDGTFAVRFNLPDRRHVLPMVASSRDGAEHARSSWLSTGTRRLWSRSLTSDRSRRSGRMAALIFFSGASASLR